MTDAARRRKTRAALALSLALLAACLAALAAAAPSAPAQAAQAAAQTGPNGAQAAPAAAQTGPNGAQPAPALAHDSAARRTRKSARRTRKSARRTRRAAKRRHRRRHGTVPRYWGAWIGDQITGTPPPEDMAAVPRFSEPLGKGLSIIKTSVPFAHCGTDPCYTIDFPAAGMQRIRDYGAIPFLSWSSFAADAEGREHEFALSSVNSGRWDAYIRQFATEARNWGHPFFLRFNWEMNGDWFPWSEGINGNGPGSFVASWRRVHDIFESVGATNATWVWCPYADPRRRFYPLNALYPGDEYVDWSCIDGYNWGRNPHNPVPWMSFDFIFSSTYRRIVRHIAPRKPMMLAEFASTGTPRAKAAWIKRMFKELSGPRYRRIRAIVWFDQVDRRVDWLLENNGPAAHAFGTGLRRGYRPNVYANLSESPIRPPGAVRALKRRAKRR